jgi:serine/threonine protein kinase
MTALKSRSAEGRSTLTSCLVISDSRRSAVSGNAVRHSDRGGDGPFGAACIHEPYTVKEKSEFAMSSPDDIAGYLDRCPACFKRIVEDSVCPCGYDASRPPSDEFPQALPPATLLDGKYRLGKVLGQGGFAITYLCFDEFLELRVAIKEYFPSDWAARGANGDIEPLRNREAYDECLSRFFQEARMLARLDHWNVVRVRNVFKAYGTAYFVMDYYEGETLGQRLRADSHRLSEVQALEVMRPLLIGLDKVHGQGILHLDIKPGNVYLTADKRPVLLDFGAARASVDAGKPLMAIGTPPYMPPEQYAGEGLGAWTDVYACAAMLYRMLTGHNAPVAERRIVLDELRPPGDRVQNLSPVLSRAILRGLALYPADRPQSALEFMETLSGLKLAPSAGALSAKVRERLARRIHQAYVDSQLEQGHTLADNPALAPWKRLPADLQESNRDQANQIEAQLRLIGCEVVPKPGAWRSLFRKRPAPFALTAEETEYLAEREHERWFEERKHAGWRYGLARDAARKISPYLLPWSGLTEEIRERDREAVRRIPQLLDGAGFDIRRLSDQIARRRTR